MSQAVPPHVAVAKHPLIFLLPIVLLLGLAIAYSTARDPEYTAHARMSSARFDVSDPGALPGFLQAGQALASVYSRAISADVVVGRVASELRLPANEVSRSLSATPVPQTPFVDIEATSGQPGRAVVLANKAAASLVAYAKTLAVTGGSRALSQKIAIASTVMSRRERELRRQTRRAARRRSRAADRSVDRAAAAVTQAQLRLDALRSAYLQLKQTQTGVAPAQLLTTARRASSDRGSRAQIALVIALLGGLLLGTAAATLRANRRRARNA